MAISFTATLFPGLILKKSPGEDNNGPTRPCCSPSHSSARTEKGKFFPTAESQAVKIEGMMELENHRLATTIVIIDLGKNHQ